MAQLNLNDYQVRAFAYAAYGEQYSYPFFALAEETGEVMGKIAKHMRKNNKTPDFRRLSKTAPELHAALVKELGDVLWNLSACALELGVSLNELASENLEKLADRAKRNKIIGEGDDR